MLLDDKERIIQGRGQRAEGRGDGGCEIWDSSVKFMKTNTILHKREYKTKITRMTKVRKDTRELS